MDKERYSRQLILKGFGKTRQEKLLNAAVLLIGAGGLGCPVLQYLVGAGIGKVGIIDHDAVQLSNLHRQVLFNTEDIGKNKAVAAAAHLQKSNPDVRFNVYPITADPTYLPEILQDYDVVVDATDNFFSRYVINDVCVLMGKPLVYGAVSQYEGQVGVFNVLKQGYVSHYRHWFPQAPAVGEVLNCAEAGVIGVVTGIIGSLQANEVIKLIVGIGSSLIHQLFTFNVLNNRSYHIKIPKSQVIATDLPGDLDAYRTFNYGEAPVCHPAGNKDLEMDPATFDSQQKLFLKIDIREQHEQPKLANIDLHIAFSEVKAALPSLPTTDIIFICQSGKRSLSAAQLATQYFNNKGVAVPKIMSLKGGVLAYIALEK